MFSRPYRRRRFILGSLQYRLVAFSMLYAAVAALTIAAVLFVPLMVQLGNDSLPLDEQAEAAQEFLTLHAHIWPALLLVLVLLAIHSIFISHRVAGPLYVLRRVFDAVLRGDLTARARIRNSDYLHEEVDHFNTVVASLEARIRTLTARQLEAERHYRAVTEASTVDLGTEGRMALNRVADALANSRSCLAEFRVAGETLSAGAGAPPDDDGKARPPRIQDAA